MKRKQIFALIIIMTFIFRADGYTIETVATFSIVAHDTRTGALGIAVASRFLAVGSVVPWAKAEIGALVTQALANPKYGPKGLALLGQGFSPSEVIQSLTSNDPDSEWRQVGIVDGQGRTAAFTGSKTIPYSGHKIGSHYIVQGNILAGQAVLEEMVKGYESARGTLADRLLFSLRAGQVAGGDKRGRQSAALLVVQTERGFGGLNDRFIDLRVDDHRHPIRELQRLLVLHQSRIQRMRKTRPPEPPLKRKDP